MPGILVAGDAGPNANVSTERLLQDGARVADLDVIGPVRDAAERGAPVAGEAS